MITVLLAVKLTIVLSLGAVGYLLSRRLSSATRHDICAITVGASLLVPLTTFHTPVLAPGVFLFAANSLNNAAPVSRTLSHWLNYVFLAGVCVVLSRFVIGVTYLRWQARRGVLADDVMPGAQLRIAPVSTPILCGWVRPMILLPLDAPHWSAERRGFAINHEIAHLERRDNWISLLAVAAQALFWFHPLVWWLSAKIAQEREIACDDRVLAAGAQPSEYADFLLDMSRHFSSAALFGCAIASHSHLLRGRIMNILHAPGDGRSAHSSRPAIALFSALLACAGIAIPATADNTTSPATQNQVYKIGGDVSAPKVIYKVEPEYTAEARNAKINGSVLLSLIIDSSGKTEDIKVVRSLDPGLDQNAIAALSVWRFAPATKNNQAVSVHANIEVNFRLK